MKWDDTKEHVEGLGNFHKMRIEAEKKKAMKEEIEKAAKEYADKVVTGDVFDASLEDVKGTAISDFKAGANWMDQQYRKRERQFKRALLKAWIEGRFFTGFMALTTIGMYSEFKDFLLWYNKQDFGL